LFPFSNSLSIHLIQLSKSISSSISISSLNYLD
jgi:hypothetical protein